MPSLYGAIVLTAGLILVYFGVREVEQVVNGIQIIATPEVTAATEQRAVAAKGAGQG